MKKFEEKLEGFKKQARYRGFNLPCGTDLTSNDYLGMRSHPALREAAIKALEDGIDMGAGGSRLLRGHTRHHAELEEFAAAHFGSEKALYFPTGFQANYALFTTLPDRHDTIIFDENIHASARDGIHAAPSRHIKVRHNDVGGFEEALRSAQQKDGVIWLAVESLYSMDGDFAPLKELYDLARKYGAVMIVDEAHATGVWGKKGTGAAEDLPQQNLITLHTCGKGVGVAGGLVCASAEITEYMINRARPFLYSTAPPPLQAVLVQKSLEILASKEGRQRREKLHKLLEHVRSKNFMKGLFKNSESQIVPIIFGADETALAAAQALQEAGFDIRAIRPPTVKEGTARLRLSIRSDLDRKTLDDFAAHLAPLFQKKKAA